jgi:hypothetical protein
MKKISTSESFLAELQEAGKIETLNESKHLKIIQNMNDHLENTRREFKIKEMKSIEAASKSILTS